MSEAKLQVRLIKSREHSVGTNTDRDVAPYLFSKEVRTNTSAHLKLQFVGKKMQVLRLQKML